MLLGNHTQLNKNPILNTGGDSTSGLTINRSNFNQAGDSRGRFYGETWLTGTADRFGVPSGYSGSYTWVKPQEPGGIGSNVGLQGVGGASASGALGVNVVSILAGSGDITSANLGLILSAVAILSGLGGLSADIIGALNASATLAGQGNFTASLGALAGAVSALTGSGSLTGSPTAKASLSSDIYVNQSTATVNDIVAGVWNAVASGFNTSGSMGQKLNGAGSAGDPWTTDLSGYNTAGTAGKELKDKLSEDNFLALK